MRRALLLAVVLVTGCRQGSGQASADVAAKSAAAKANKEMSDLLKKADALTAANHATAAAAPQPAPQEPAPSAIPPVAVASVAPTLATPAKSKADVMRDQAAAEFGDRLRSLRRTSEAARLKKDRYQQVCQGRAAIKAECQQLTTDVEDGSKTVEHELGDIQDAARRAQIDPGVMRDLLAKYGF